ncbi:hypothetical protein Metbo_1796 [Methanobacterium lacus]|uniref:Uncharacterized protein n=1 Tax=Methanobacterium lacus (strain AL-21) TaxID=877455 RepID=F0TA68_METLA|nr:hypothetical protein [Methanobacterium lacus]ADZ10018.1 hypothetical protein Metbo_1796 [Methanobacterium lacus]
MENKKTAGKKLLDSIKDRRKMFHSKARFPNAILINSNDYSVLKDFINIDTKESLTQILDLAIFISDDVPSFQLIRTYDHDDCSV